MTELITIGEFCKRTSIKPSTVRYWRGLGDRSPLTFVKIGKPVRIPVPEVERIIKRNSIGGVKTDAHLDRPLTNP